MLPDSLAQVDSRGPCIVLVMTAPDDRGHWSFDCHNFPGDEVGSPNFIFFAQHWWFKAKSPPVSLIYMGLGWHVFHTDNQDDFTDALKETRLCTIVKLEWKMVFERPFQNRAPEGLPWTGRMQLMDGSAVDQNSSEQTQMVLSKREMQIVPSKRKKLIAEESGQELSKRIRAVQEPSERTKAIQDRRKGYQRNELRSPKLLTVTTSAAASHPSQEYDLPGSETSTQVSPEGRFYEVDDEHEL